MRMAKWDPNPGPAGILPSLSEAHEEVSGVNDLAGELISFAQQFESEIRTQHVVDFLNPIDEILLSCSTLNSVKQTGACQV